MIERQEPVRVACVGATRGGDGPAGALDAADAAVVPRRVALDDLPADGVDAVVCVSTGAVEAVVAAVDGSVPVVALFDGTDPDAASAALTAGADEVFPDPTASGGGRPDLLADHLERTVDRRRTAAYHRDLFEAAGDAIFVCDPETGGVRDVNARACELTGYDRERICDLGVEGLSADDDDAAFTRDRVRSVAERLAAGEEVESREWTVRTAAGERRWLEVNPTRTTVGGTDRLLAVARDVTDRKLVERTRAELFENVADGLVLHDPSTGEIRRVNDRFCELTGYDREELVGSSVDLISADGYSFEEANRRIETARTEGPQLFEWVNERKGGTEVPVEVHLSVVEFEGDRSVLASVRDITDRKERERERRRTERQLRQIAEAVEEVIHMTTPDFSETDYVSPAYEDVWGRPSDELAADPTAFLDAVHPEDRELVREWLDDLVDELTDPAAEVDESYSGSFRIERGDGGVRHVDARFYPIRDPDGDVVRVVSVMRDVTDERRRERTLEAFDEATGDLPTAETRAEAARTAVSAAESVLGLNRVAVYLHDEGDGTLVPAAATDGLAPDAATLDPFTPEDEVPWTAFVEGSPVRLDATDRTLYPDRSTRADLLLPLGSHGLLVVGRPTGAASLATDDAELAHVLGATLEGALTHVRDRRKLRVSEQKLQRRTRRLDRLDRLNALIRDVDGAIVEGSTRRAIERTVCDRLTSVHPYAGAWVGESVLGDGGVERTAEAGTTGALDGTVGGTEGRAPGDGERPDGGTGATDQVAVHPAVRARNSGSVELVENLVDAPGGGWRDRLLANGVQSLCAVPLCHDRVVRGVLVVLADSPDAFGERERAVFEELGRSIGHAMVAVERKRALESAPTTELEFGVSDRGLAVVDAAYRTGCEVRLRRAVRRADGSVRLALALTGDPGDSPREALASAPRVDGVEVLSRSGDGLTLGVDLADWFGGLLAEFGATVRSATAEDGEGTVVADLPRDGDLRVVVDRFRRAYPDSELRAKRGRDAGTGLDAEGSAADSAGDPRREFVDRVTERQREVVETAHERGYFEWPRDHTGEEVASRLGITQATFNRHLRLAERAAFDVLLE